MNEQNKRLEDAQNDTKSEKSLHNGQPLKKTAYEDENIEGQVVNQMQENNEEQQDKQVEEHVNEQQDHLEETVRTTQMIGTETNEGKPKRKKRGSGFFNMLAAGIIGSALTLGVVTQTDLLQVEPEVQDVEKEAPVSSSTPVSTDATDITDVIEHSSKTIVGITNYGKQQNPFQQSTDETKQGTGSGVIYDVTDDAAYIITNHHVIDGANKVSVSLYDGETVEAKLVGTDPLTDTAVIKIEGEYDITPLPFGDSDQVRSGESVIAIGNPLGLELSRTVTQGIISAVDRSINVQTVAGDWELDVIQTDAAINPGNSGGALINSNGELIGINSLKIASNNVEGLGFAIPSNDVKSIVEQLRENGQVERPYLGVGLQDVRTIPSFYMPSLPDKVKAGAIVVSVDQNSAAGKAGLQEEDIIIKMNDVDIESDRDVRKFLYKEADIGDDISLTIYRDGKKQTLELTLTSNLTDQVS